MAQSKGIEMPGQPNKEHQAALKKLQNAKGDEKTLKLVQEAANKAKDAELKAMAQKAAPEIEKHLQMAKQLSDQASAGASAAPERKETK
jgi:Domain of unknown function (DUF4142)